jgi:hypothetical protein
MLEKITKVKLDQKLLLNLTKVCDIEEERIERTRDLTKTWAYFDMDMFFVAVEIRD